MFLFSLRLKHHSCFRIGVFFIIIFYVCFNTVYVVVKVSQCWLEFTWLCCRELAQHADMWELPSLRDSIVFHLQQEYCHFFHKVSLVGAVTDLWIIPSRVHSLHLTNIALGCVCQHFNIYIYDVFFLGCIGNPPFILLCIIWPISILVLLFFYSAMQKLSGHRSRLSSILTWT